MNSASKNKSSSQKAQHVDAKAKHSKISDLLENPLIKDAIAWVASNETIHSAPKRLSETEIRQLIEEFDQQTFNYISLGASLFPSEIPHNATFYKTIQKFGWWLGFTESSRIFTATLSREIFDYLTPEKRDLLLSSLTALDTHSFFQALEQLPEWLKLLPISPEFAEKWFLQLQTKIGDSFTGGFWNGLVSFAQNQPSLAIEVLKRYYPNLSKNNAIGICTALLGGLRSAERHKKGGFVFNEIEEQFKNGDSAEQRTAYYRSWLTIAFEGLMTRADIQHFISLAKDRPSEVNEILISLVRCLKSKSIPSDGYREGLLWLDRVTNSSLSDFSKYEMASLSTFANWDDPAEKEFCFPIFKKLILAMQPLPSEGVGGIWHSIDETFSRLLRTDRDLFLDLFKELAEANAKNLLQIMKKDDGMPIFLPLLNQYDTGPLLTFLFLNKKSAIREIGFFLSHRVLGISNYSMLNSANSLQLQQLFYHLQSISFLDGEVVAGLLLMILSQEGKLPPDFRHGLLMEIRLQSINYGSCNVYFTNKKNEFAILDSILKETEEYFEKIRITSDSTSLKFQIPGFDRAAQEYFRRFNNEISKGAKEKSIFASLVKNVHVIYGELWSNYTGNKLSAATVYTPISVSTEIPRMEYIEPENMELRRLGALMKLREIKKLL